MTDLAARIAIAEEKSELTKKIEATKKVLAGAREKAIATEHKSSPVVHQNEFLAKAVALVGFEHQPRARAPCRRNARAQRRRRRPGRHWTAGRS